MKKMVTGVLALVMVLVMVGCGQKDNGVVNGVAKDGATIGEGAKSFTMEVVAKDGGKVTFTVKTDADTVGKALLDQGVIAGEDGSYKYAVIHPGQDISPLIKALNAQLHGRGGGRDGFAQGSAACTEEEILRFWAESA